MRPDTSEGKFRDELKSVMDRVNPGEGVKQRVWNEVVTEKKRTKKTGFSAVRVAFAATCVMALAISSAVGVNAATEGDFFQSIKEFCGLTKQQKVVAEETITLPNDVYAPQLVECTDSRLIVANERGLLVYDRQNQKAVAALDLQALECNYLNADTIVTRLFVQDDVLYLFNEAKETKSSGKTSLDVNTDRAYTYDLTIAGTEEALGMTENTAELETIRAEYRKHSASHRFDTFDRLQSETLDLNELITKENCSYSEEGYAWEDCDGMKKLSFLVASEEADYWLYTTEDVGQPVEKVALLIASGEDEMTADASGENVKDNALPGFVYTGEDEVMAALCEEALKEAGNYYLQDGGVFIPAPVILDTVSKGNTLVVFCFMDGYGYYRNGNTLNCEGGGSSADRLKLEKQEDGTYKVVEHLTAGDGSDYGEDIKSFCKGYWVSHRMYFRDDTKLREDIRRELIRMYVENNGLDIRYYKDYGWDPVELF